jgi:hypothetical protein
MIRLIEGLVWSVVCVGMLYGMFMVLDKLSRIPMCKEKTQWTSLIN